MDVEEPLHLADDVVESTGLVAGGGGEGVAVHRVADPGHLDALGRDLLHQAGQAVADLVGAEAGDEREAARGVLRVELRRQGQRVVGGGRGAELHADGVADVAEVLHVGAVELTGALPDPHEVARDVVGLLGAGVDAGHRVLVLHQQRLVAGVEVDAAQLLGVGADGLHERQRLVDLAGQLLVALARGRGLHEVGVPSVDLAQVGVAAGDEGAHEVERRGGGVVGVEQPLGVGDARLGGELEAVDHVAAVGREGDLLAVDDPGLLVGAARLGVLAGQPAQLHDGHRAGVGHDDGHLQQHPQLVADVVGGDLGEGLRAVAALQQERLAAGDRGQLVGEVVALAREDQRGHGAQSGHGVVERPAVGVRRLLEGADRVQALEGRDAHRSRVRRAPPRLRVRGATWTARRPWSRSTRAARRGRGTRSSWRGCRGW